jgi:hypothetical protein
MIDLVDYLRDKLAACTCMSGGAWEVGSVRATMVSWQPGCPVHTAEDVEAKNAQLRDMVLDHVRVHASKRRPRRSLAQRGIVVWPFVVALAILFGVGLIEWFRP